MYMVLRTFYYPSRVPMAISEGQSAQPYKYNGKEYVEMYGLDEYAYGFRNYNATIGRFVTIDPLAEGNLNVSPYAYANNNFVNKTDWMGLTSSVPYKQEYVAVDKEGRVIGYDVNSEDHHVYRVDENGDGTHESLQKYPIIGWEIPCWTDYTIGEYCYYLASTTAVIQNAKSYSIYGKQQIAFGNDVLTDYVDDNFYAALKYYIGFMQPQLLGSYNTRNALFRNPSFIKELRDLLNDNTYNEGHFSIDMTNYLFHIGNTSIHYYSTSNYIVFSMGINDGFWDVLKFLEKDETHPNRIRPDGMGYKLEIGLPYPYIPMTILIPK